MLSFLVNVKDRNQSSCRLKDSNLRLKEYALTNACFAEIPFKTQNLPNTLERVRQSQSDLEDLAAFDPKLPRYKFESIIESNKSKKCSVTVPK